MVHTWAWAAGLFEGEGCITRKKNSNRYELKINLTDLDILEKFQEVVGCGNINQQKYKSKNHHKDIWKWGIYNKADITRLLINMLPYFGNRRACTALNCLDTLDY